MCGFSISLQAKALCSLVATLGVAGSVLWQWRDDPAAPLVVQRPPALPLSVQSVSDKPHAPSNTFKTVVVRSASNLGSIQDAVLLAQRLQNAGVQRVWVQFKQDETDEFTGGSVFYPSKIAPVADGFQDGRLMTFVQELSQRDIKVAAWLPALHDPTAWQSHPEWGSKWVNEDGEIEEQSGWLCPRHPEAIAYEASLLAEVAALCKDKIAGIYTDFIRYDDDFSCACERCLSELSLRMKGRKIRASELRAASVTHNRVWEAWTALRGDSIHDALNAMRDALTDVAPDLWFGASVLPFSALDYGLNTQSGQDLEKMCLAGVDEIVLMGYWDDWDESPAWLQASVAHAKELVGDEAKLSCLIDADMSVGRTMKTLEALKGGDTDLAWFNYGEWSQEVVQRLHRATDQFILHRGMPRAAFTAVVLRIDTEPDADHRYNTVQPEMIDTLVDMFAQENIKATFVTCGKLAQMQPTAIRRALAAGHEIAGHAYDHEQIDSLSEPQQVFVIDQMMSAFEALQLRITGFGAPRNSITDVARDRLIDHGLFYDGSEAYDPMTGYIDPQIVAHTEDPKRGIVVLPFVVPNDYDARFVLRLDAAQMLQAWTDRLSMMADAGEACFVIDIHQWIASRPDNLEAVRQFIHAVKSRPDCRIMTLEDAAHHVVDELGRTEGALVARP